MLCLKLCGLSADDEEEPVSGDRRSHSAQSRSALAAQLPPDGRGNSQAASQPGRASRHGSLAGSDDEQDLDVHGSDIRQAPAPNLELPDPMSGFERKSS